MMFDLPDFEKYQEAAREFAEYEEEAYPFVALAEEVGEFLSIPAKMLRGDDVEAKFPNQLALRNHLLKEAGDVLWQLSQCLEELGLSLREAAEMNLQKLEDRKARGVIKGSGNNR